MAYASKYYDPVKAHEYYMKHRKLKSREKRGSVAGLNEAGKIAAAEVKEQLKAELKAALKKLPRGAKEARQKLREEYNEKYYAELDKMKQDTAMSKTAKSTKSASAKAPKAPKEKDASQKKTSDVQDDKKKTAKKKKTESKEQIASKAMKQIAILSSLTEDMTDEQKDELKPRLDVMINKITERLNKGSAVSEKTQEKINKTVQYAKAIKDLVRQFNNLPDDEKEKVRSRIQGMIDNIAKRLKISTTDLGGDEQGGNIIEYTTRKRR